MQKLILNYSNYNIWANKKMAQFLLDIEPNLLDVEQKSSFSTIRKTVHHIWDAELIWLSRLQNKIVSWPPSAAFKDPAISQFVDASIAFNEFIKEQNESFFSSKTSYKNSNGVEFVTENSDIIMHCFNHSTYHRGQLVTMLRNVDYTNLSSLDMITFVRENK